MKKPAVALDVETTGLDERQAELLSLSLILETPDSFRNNVETKHLPHLSLIFVKETPLQYLEEAAGAMNAALLKQISEYRFKNKEKILQGQLLYVMSKEGKIASPDFFQGTHAVTPEAGLVLINEFFKWVYTNHGTLELFGKNIGKFDLQVTQNYLDRNVQDGSNIFRRILDAHCSYRYGDLGTMFYPYFNEMVSLSKIVSLFGDKDEVSHVAYEDGIDSIKARRLALYAFEKGVRDPEGLKELAKEIK